MNKNGVKLLAAVMVFAMAFAGVVTLADNDSAAGISSATAATDSITEAGDYYVNINMTVTVDVKTEGNVSLYVLEGMKVTIKATADNKSSVTVWSYSIKEETNTEVANSNVPLGAITNEGGSYVYTADKESPTFSGTFTKDIELGSIVKYSVKFTSTEKITYYAIGATIPTTNLNQVGSSVIVLDGSVVVNTDYNNMKGSIRLDNVKSDAGVTVSIDQTNGPTIGGTPKAGNIAITSGAFSDTDSSFVPSGFANIFKITANTTVWVGSISTSVTNETNYPGISAIEVNGTITQKTSYEPKSEGQIEKTVDLTIAEGSAFIISENVSVNVKKVTINESSNTVGILKVFGNLVATSGTGPVYVGPNGSVNGITTLKNTNVTSGDDSFISGEPTAPTLNNAILTGSLIVPKGYTLTLNGNLGLNGHSIKVDGTLIINNKASIFGTGTPAEKFEGIILGETGSIQNNGTIGSKTEISVSNGSETDAAAVTVKGVTGVEFGFTKTKLLYVSGNITAIRNAVDPMVTLTGGAVINGDVTIGSKVSLIGDKADGTILTKNTTLTVNGILANGIFKIGEGAELIVNGTFGEKVTATDDSGNEDGEGQDDVDTQADGTAGAVVTVNILTGQYDADTNAAPTDYESVSVTTTTGEVKGFTLYNQRVAVPNESTGTTDYFLRAYINGTVQYGGEEKGGGPSTSPSMERSM